MRAFEAGFEIGAKTIDAGVIGAVLSRQLLRGDLDPARSQEFLDQMRVAGLPT